ncbi:thioredoxin fold domain-containing protein [Verminephrobacter eiseniae]|uniref:thioredoxin fold domain-containing protein n=2 Tax=Verminephrobacter eiseniae TaxID=364317 RepID=UPI002238406D|nr:thioredoxin fold domain-containing protein [Verminephrobacter eiseniae]
MIFLALALLAGTNERNNPLHFHWTGSSEKSQNIWCSKNRSETYVTWMAHGVVPAKAQCDTAAIERNKAFGQEHSIRGTPHLIFKSGRAVPAAVDTDRLSRMLQ